MEYWATLKYAGAVVMSVGGENMSLDECKEVTALMLSDINQSYIESPEVMEETVFPTNEFEVSCEEEMLPVDEKYRAE